MNMLMNFFPLQMPRASALIAPPYAGGFRLANSRKKPPVLARTQHTLSGNDGGALPDGEELERLAESIVSGLGNPSRLALVLSDAFFKMQILTLTEFPAKESERLQVLKWHVRKSLNYSLEDTRLRYSILEKRSGSVTIWLTLASETALNALEKAFKAVGSSVGHIGAVTPELFNLAVSRGGIRDGGAYLILNRSGGSTSFLFTNGRRPVYYRQKEISHPSDDKASGQRLSREVRLTMAYYQERLGGAPLAGLFYRSWPSGLELPMDEFDSGLNAVSLDELAANSEDARRALLDDPALLPLFGVVET